MVLSQIHKEPRPKWATYTQPDIFCSRLHSSLESLGRKALLCVCGFFFFQSLILEFGNCSAFSSHVDPNGSFLWAVRNIFCLFLLEQRIPLIGVNNISVWFLVLALLMIWTCLAGSHKTQNTQGCEGRCNDIDST
jgi:hypothetical protein